MEAEGVELIQLGGMFDFLMIIARTGGGMHDQLRARAAAESLDPQLVSDADYGGYAAL